MEENTFKEFQGKFENARGMKFIMETSSMAPIISPGDKVVAVPATLPLRRFDIIVFWAHNKLICHYVWHKNTLSMPGSEETYVTRNMYFQEDLPVPVSSILGIVISHKLTKLTRFKFILKSLFNKR